MTERRYRETFKPEAEEAMWLLFHKGPSKDDALPEPGLEQLHRLGYVGRYARWAFLTPYGVEEAIYRRMDERKAGPRG